MQTIPDAPGPPSDPAPYVPQPDDLVCYDEWGRVLRVYIGGARGPWAVTCVLEALPESAKHHDRLATVDFAQNE